uniref:Uncharacterized protein n=1 Tax=viral metagenome TaxID=1070528 RepID=A0A6C0JLA7_9ZZZZ
MAKKDSANLGNGGIMGSGIFGHFGTLINCDSKDDSMYCNIMKFFNLFLLLVMFLVIFYFAYTLFIKPYFNSKKR